MVQPQRSMDKMNPPKKQAMKCREGIHGFFCEKLVQFFFIQVNYDQVAQAEECTLISVAIGSWWLVQGKGPCN